MNATAKKLLQCSLLFNCLLTLVLGVSHAQIGEPYQLSGEMVPFGDAFDFKISPDGQYVVYLADQDKDGVPSLYSVPIDGSATVKPIFELGVLLNFRVLSFEISPDSKYVVFIVRNTTGQRIASVPITGGDIGDIIDLSAGALNDNSFVSSFRISADSQTVVYVMDKDTENKFELFSILITGGNIRKLNPNLGPDREVLSFRISPNNQHVVYEANLRAANFFDLYSVPISGSEVPTQLNVSTDRVAITSSLQFSPDSRRVIFLARGNGPLKLYSVPVTGGTPVLLDEGLTDVGIIERVQISSDSQWVIYNTFQSANSSGNLYSAPIAGGRTVRLASNSIRSLRRSPEFKISPDSQSVVYRADPSFDSVVELYSVPILGGSQVRLNPDLVEGGDVFDGFQISSNSQRVVYSATQRREEEFEIYSVPIGGGEAIRLNADLQVDGDVIDFQISPNNLGVIYRADQDANNVNELYYVGINGGTITKLNAELPFGSDVDRAEFSPDGKFVVYRADQDVFDEDEIFAIQLESEDDELCLPIKTKNGNVAVICL